MQDMSCSLEEEKYPRSKDLSSFKYLFVSMVNPTLRYKHKQFCVQICTPLELKRNVGKLIQLCPHLSLQSDSVLNNISLSIFMCYKHHRDNMYTTCCSMQGVKYPGPIIINLQDFKDLFRSKEPFSPQYWQLEYSFFKTTIFTANIPSQFVLLVVN